MFVFQFRLIKLKLKIKISQSEQGNDLGNQTTKTELNPVIPKNLIRKPASFFRVSNITYPIDEDGSVIKSSQAITFVSQFPVKANVPYGRKAGRPAHIENQSLLAIDHSKQTNDIEYEKAKIDTWTETVRYEETKILVSSKMRLLSIEDNGVLPKKEAKKAEPFTIEILFTEQDELKIVGPRKKLSDGYCLGWLSNVRFGSYDFLHTIELSNISVDSNSCHCLLGLIERNARFLYKLKFYHCTYPKEMWKMVSGDEFKKMKYLHTFQLVTPTLEMNEVLDLVDKFPNTLKELSIGDFDFGEQYMEGISFIGKLGRLKELYLLHLYYYGDQLFEKMVDLGLSKEMREELRNFKMSNMNNGPFVRKEPGKESGVMNEITKRKKEGRM